MCHQTHTDAVTSSGVREDEGEERREENLEAAWARVEEEVAALEAGCGGRPGQNVPTEPLKDSSVECPICGETFPSYVVEVHASTCGSDADRTERLVDPECVVID